jgi:hypothetical protein
MSSWKWFLLSFFGAGIAFWIPDIVIPAMDRTETGEAVTIACPAVLLLFYAVLIRIRRAERTGLSTAIFAICGIWMLALSFTMLAQWIRSEGGLGEFSRSDFGYLFISSFLPWRIIEGVSLEGSIFALWIGTAAMIICHFKFEETRWIVPPSVWAAIKQHRKEI